MSILTSLDFFAKYIHWHINKQKKIYTFLGGIISIISFLICLTIFILLFEDLIKRENPQINEDDEPQHEYQKIKFGKEKIYIPWTISDYSTRKVNFTGWLYPIIYYFYGERDKSTGAMPYDYKILNYRLCNETDLKKLDYYQDTYVNFDTLFCIEMENEIMGGSYFDEFIYHIQMDFYLCEDGVNMGTKGKKCTNYDDLVEHIGKDNAWHIEIYYPEVQFKPKDQKNPIGIFYNTHFYNFNKLNTKVERLYLKQFTLIDDQGWIFVNKKNESLWGFDKIESDSYVRSSDGKEFINDFSSSKIYSLVVYLNRNKKIYSRKYTKLLDALGNIISIVHGAYIFIKIISRIFIESFQDKCILKYLLLENENNKNKSKKISMPFIVNEHIENSNNFSVVNKSYNEFIHNAKIDDKKKKCNYVNKKKEKAMQNFPIKLKSSNEENRQIENENSSDVFNFKNLCQQKRIWKKLNILDKKNNANDCDDRFIVFLNRLKSIKNTKMNYSVVSRWNLKDINFPFYYYIFNFISQIFGLKKTYCVNNNFNNAWENMINILDVKEYVQLQSNVSLICNSLVEFNNDRNKEIDAT